MRTTDPDDRMVFIDVVAGILFDESRSRVLLALRKPEQHQGNLWEFPGGKLQEDESLEDGLTRELQEEIGIEVRQCSPRRVIEHRYPDKQVRLHFCDVTSFRGEPRGCEGQQVQWVSLDQLACLDFPEANQPIVDELLSLSACSHPSS